MSLLSSMGEMGPVGVLSGRDGTAEFVRVCGGVPAGGTTREKADRLDI